MTWKAFDDDTDSNTEAPRKDQEPGGVSTYSNSCCGRFLAELNPCQPQFAVQDRATGRVFDIPESFSPPPGLWTVLLFKVATTTLALFVLIYGWIDGPDMFYLAMASHWGVLFSSLYFLCSLLNTILESRTPQPAETAGWRIRAAWVLAEIASHSGGIIIANYCYMLYEQDNKFAILNVATSGGLALLVWIDVLFVNRIPFRWVHWLYYVLPEESLWVIWSVLHALVFDLGNPYSDGSSGDPDTNDDLLYEFLDWEGDWERSAILSAIALFGLGPVIFLILWWISIYQFPCLSCFCSDGRRCNDKRKYLDSFKDHLDPRPTVNDVEEGSVFAKWGSCSIEEVSRRKPDQSMW
jgi:hypothetical protein